MSIDFNDSTLFISARSPFARRARLTLLEHGVRFEEKVLDVFKPNPDLWVLNPLARVPTLRFKSGEVMIDSEKIIGLFYKLHPESAFLPKSDSEWLIASNWSATALGLCEKSVEYYLECLRPEEHRDRDLLEEVRDVAHRVLERFNTIMRDQQTLLPGRLTQGDLDMGAALAYFSLRVGTQWKSAYTHAAAFLQKIEERPSFQATRPPAA